jgi:alpha-methylacyl-CoA racemase
MTETSRALDGIRVLDLSRLAPGPYCSMLLADFGADVVMVAGGRTGAPIPVLRRGKHAVDLDLKTPDGRGLLDRMVERADVLIESFRPGVAARLGADHSGLAGSTRDWSPAA